MTDWKQVEITFKEEKKAEPLCGGTYYFIQIEN